MLKNTINQNLERDEIATTKIWLTRRYMGALILIGITSVVAFILLSLLIETQKSAGAIVNASGRRRYTSQRIVLFSSFLVNAKDDTERKNARNGMQSTIEILEKNHFGLVKGDPTLNLPGRMSPEISAFYNEKPTELNLRLLKYIASAKSLLAAPDATLNQENPDYRYIVENGPTNIIKDLEAIVNLYQKEIDADVVMLHRLEMIVLGFTLALLIAVARFIFRPMTFSVEKSMRDVQNAAEDVKQRTNTIQTIYDNVKSGFLLVDQDLKIQSGFSKSCRDLLGGELAQGMDLVKALGLSQREGEHFRSCIGEVFYDFMPESVTLSQTPQKFSIGGKAIRLEGSVIRNANNEVQLVMFTINDMTAQVSAEHKNRMYETIVLILQQKDAFMSYIIDMKKSFGGCRESIEKRDFKQARFFLHTMKGNSAVFGITQVANMIHDLESQENISIEILEQIEITFRGFIAENAGLLQVSYEEDLQRKYLVKSNILDTLKDYVLSSKDVAKLRLEILAWIKLVKQVPFATVAETLKKATEALAARLEKDVEINIHGGDVQVDPEYLMPILQNLIHIIRNCLDHGIEGPSERGNKSEFGNIRIGIEATTTDWMLTLTDDGRGIDTEKVIAKALKLGVISLETASKLSDEEKLLLIFEDGLSTAEKLSDVSGRGVGMLAVKTVVEEMNGRIEIFSQIGSGTTFTIIVPQPTQAAEMVILAA